MSKNESINLPNHKILCFTMMLASVSTALLRQPALAMCRCQTNHANRELLVKRSPSFITTLTLNRPKANAMGAVLMSQFNEALKELEDDNDATRCVIIKSSLPKVFCAGADLKERRGMTLEQAEATVDGLRESLQRLACLPMPTLAVVEGVAVGGGLELALATDIIISSHAASFGLPETSLGIIPGAGGTQRLPRRIGAARALEWIATGQRIDSITAHDYGLVQYVEDDAYAKAVE